MMVLFFCEFKLFRFVILVYIYVFLIDSPVVKSAATVAICIVVGLTVDWLSTASGIIQGIIAGILCSFIMFINWHKVWQFITHIKYQHRQQTTDGNNVRLNERF